MQSVGRIITAYPVFGRLSREKGKEIDNIEKCWRGEACSKCREDFREYQKTYQALCGPWGGPYLCSDCYFDWCRNAYEFAVGDRAVAIGSSPICKVIASFKEHDRMAEEGKADE